MFFAGTNHELSILYNLTRKLTQPPLIWDAFITFFTDYLDCSRNPLISGNISNPQNNPVNKVCPNSCLNNLTLRIVVALRQRVAWRDGTKRDTMGTVDTPHMETLHV